MEEINVVCKVLSARLNDLSDADKVLLNEAEEASKKAYAPYSAFRVGAALRMKDGTIIRGNNQENVAYPSGLCAERVALFYASANFPGMAVESMAIAASTDQFNIKEPITPCGSCRQVLVESENSQDNNIRILMKGKDDTVYVVESAKSLLPLMFKADELKSIK